MEYVVFLTSQGKREGEGREGKGKEVGREGEEEREGEKRGRGGKQREGEGREVNLFIHPPTSRSPAPAANTGN